MVRYEAILLRIRFKEAIIYSNGLRQIIDSNLL